MQRPEINTWVLPPSGITANDGFPAIPTFGHPAGGFDAYKTVAVGDINHKSDSWCFTDIEAASALGRIIDGPIRSWQDIERAESALRAILLHDFIEILVPCVKGEIDTGIISYLRFDDHLRNQAAFSALQVANCRDYLFATEYVHVSKGEITASSNANSELIGNNIQSNDINFSTVTNSSRKGALALPMTLGAATYYTSDAFAIRGQKGTAGFIDDLYERIYKPWVQVAQNGPVLFTDIKLPPFIAIVLSRANTRENIPDVLRELREQLADVRSDLIRMNKMLERPAKQAEIYAQVQRINESFDAIVAESLLTPAERRFRRITQVFNFINPVRQLYSAAVDPLTISPGQLEQFFKSTHSAVLQNSRIVSRSVTAATFAELLKVDSVHDIVHSHFSHDEIELLSEENK